MYSATPITTINESKKRMLDDADLMTSNKRLNTGFGSPDSMTMANDNIMSCPLTTSTTATAMPIDQQANALQYHLSPNATTPAYAPCNAYSTTDIPRPSTPPYSMTLAHYNESSGGYTSTLIDF
ncbi:hypothetical protein BC941DRAFT_509102 [Chlamydoabsidia padenii]|nr:hypothetical protein BC941DRAFT_509102 [Chlamydoabsidia padenii]